MKLKLYACLACIALSLTTVSAFRGDGRSASGNYHAASIVVNPGVSVVFDVTAKKNEKRAQGSWVQTDYLGNTYAGTIDCAYFDGNKVWISGVVTDAGAEDGLWIGGRFILRVTDGGVDGTDTTTIAWVQDSVVAATAPYDCHDAALRAFVEERQASEAFRGDLIVDSGDIQVGN